jgi:hypothetical protein
MAQHYGSYFYLRHADKAEIDRLRDAIMNQTEIAEIWELQFKTINVEYVEILEYDEGKPNRIVLKFEFKERFVSLLEALEESGFRVVAHIYDLSGCDAWVFANDEIVPIPNWLDAAWQEDFGERNPDSLEGRLEQRKKQIEERRRTFFFDLKPTPDTRLTWPNFPRVPVDHGLPSEEETRERWSRKDSEDEEDTDLAVFQVLAAGR